jgi:hypothetical protein
MIHQIAEDVVERRLELVGRRGIALALVQSLLVIVIVAFVGSFLAVTVSQMVAKLPADWLGRFDCWWRLIAALLIMGVPAVLIGGAFLRLVLTASDGWHRLTWDGRAGELVARRRGGVLGWSQATTIPLPEIRRIDLHAAPGGRNLNLKFTFHSGKQLQRQPLEATVHVRHVDRREEALDLLFRIGRICGVGYYAIESSDLRNLKARLLREPKNSERFQPIPDGSSAARYEDDVVSPHVPAPAPRVGKFQRSAYEQSVTSTRLVEWQPGQLIHFHQPPPDRATYCVAAIITATIAGIIAYQMAPLTKAWLPWWGTVLVAICVATLAVCFVIWLTGRERETIFDWSAGQVSWRVGNRWKHAALNAINDLRLRGLKQTVTKKKGPSYTLYSCRLEMVVAGRSIYILESDKFRDLPDAPADRLGPLAAALGESLHVPWQWREYDA